MYFKKQYAALRAMCVEKKSCAGCIADRIRKISHFTSNVRFHSKWLCTWRRKAIDSTVIAVSPLNALMRDQLQILGGVLNMFTLKLATLFRTTNVDTGK